MKISGIVVDRFGIWDSMRLEGLSDALNVFYGPNETGKTTLMQFIRTVLYGFSPPRRQRYLPGDGGPAGGSLLVREQGQALVLQRHIDGEGYESELRIRDGRGQPAKAAQLEKCLREVDETIFNHVFAMGLHDLEQLGALSDTAAGEFLFRLASGLNGASLFDVMAELENSRNRLLASDDRPCQIVHFLGQKERLAGEIQELKGLNEQYEQLHHERRELDAEMERLQAEQRERTEELSRLQLAQRIAPAWNRRRAIDAALQREGTVSEPPADALPRLEALERNIALARQRLATLRARRQKLAARAGKITVNEPLWRDSARIEAFCDQQAWVATLEDQLAAVDARAKAAARRLKAARARTGWLGGASSVEPSAEKLAQLRAAARRLAATRKALRATEEKTRQQREALAVLERQLREALAGKSAATVSAALEEAGMRASGWRRRLQLDEQAQKLTTSLKELEAQRLDLLERQVMPGWVIAGMSGVFAVGVALLLAGLVLPLAGSGLLGLAFACLGVAGAVGAVGAKFVLERRNHRRLERCENQLSTLAVQIRQNHDEREALDKQLPRGGGSLTARVQTAEKELAELEELIPLDTQRQSLERELATLGQSLEAQKKEATSTRAQWRKLLAAAGLPSHVAPGQVRSLSRVKPRLDKLERKLDALVREREQRAAGLAQLAERIRPLMEMAGIEPADESLTRRLSALQEAFTKTADAARLRQRLRRRGFVLARRGRKLRDSLRLARQQWRAVLRETGASDAAALRASVEKYQRICKLHDERAAVDAEIAQALAGAASEPELAPLVAALGEQGCFEARASELTTALSDLDARLRKALERRGELNERLKTLAADRRPGYKQLQHSLVRHQLGEAIRRWQVLALTRSILDKLCRDYERQRQPETLRLASVYLQRLTSGRYGRIWTPLGQRVLRVDQRQAGSLNVDVLSRGTREQVYLALRLALVKGYAKRGVHLPLVMDDLLVNFDGQRARAAATVLREFADEGHQVLLFTCHEHIGRLFRGLHVRVRAMPGCAGLEPGGGDDEARSEIAAQAQSATGAPAPPVVVQEPPPASAAPPDAKARRSERPTVTPGVAARSAPIRDNSAEEFAGEFAERSLGGGAAEPAVDGAPAANQDHARGSEAA
jgi:uncharacterized protein YhaN